MYKKYLSAGLVIILLLWPVMPSVSVYAEGSEQNTESMESLMATVSIDDASLETEAERFGIPEAETKRYVADMRSLNKQYQQGSLTRTEYIGLKRELIEQLK
ncbi:MAG: hypothetical protein U9R44_03290 [Candidatus Omnitrophota bacterium]|nr:hypothetical protein [Candidatus Omnitrophota bacterium]